MADVSYNTLVKDYLVTLRNTLRNDSNLMVSILGLSGTAEAINNVFVGRPRNERVNSSGEPDFPLPRIVVDAIGGTDERWNNNEDGFHDDEMNAQISIWTSNTPFSLAYDAVDRIKVLISNNDFTVTSGFMDHKTSGWDVIDDPDRHDTKMGTVKTRAQIKTSS